MTKSFKSNASAVMQFISTPEEPQNRPKTGREQAKPILKQEQSKKKPEPAPVESKAKEEKKVTSSREKKDKQIALFLKPSILEGITKLAEQEDRSRNDYINKVLEEHIKGVK